MNGRPPRVGLNLFAHPSYRAAAGPLFEEGLVDALEWDVDDSWGVGGGIDRRPTPDWVEQLLDVYSESDSLYGHGVWFSVLSARWETRQERWLEDLRAACRRRRYRHLSEHFGFMTAGDFTRATMFPVPHTPAAVRIGRDRLSRIAEACGVPVGLENTAVALCAADARDQGAFLDDLLRPSDGFLLFDLHNLWAQCRNLGLSAGELLPRYPLTRVRELHVSGGSWYQPSHGRRDQPFRLDSHDGPVADEALELVPFALRHCPNLEVVFLEHRGANLDTPEAVVRYQSDFLRLRALVESFYEAA
jgi:uncharacterized protein (UPF0276 family)